MTWPWWEAVLVFLVGNVVLGAATVAALVGLRDDAPAQVMAGLAADLVFLAAMLGWLGAAIPAGARAWASCPASASCRSASGPVCSCTR